MPNLYDVVRNQISNLWSGGNQKTEVRNLYNEAFLWSAGGGYTDYPNEAPLYIDKGYNINPMVYSVINQQAVKTSNIPFYVKRIEDKNAVKKLKNLKMVTKGNLSPQQFIKQILLENKAYSDEDIPFPMESPNKEQSWSEFMALWKTFMKSTGNAYMYMLAPEDGVNAGEPLQIYLLPAHLVQIIIKPTSSIMYADEDAVQGYILLYGTQFIEFPATAVIHTKYPNPNYNQNGEHLYGQSPLRAALKNIQSSNVSLDLNIKTLKSGGAFGLIHGKREPITVEQAAEIKERLSEMHNSPEDLSKIGGISAEIGFTRLSLTSEELRPFDYLSFDQKQICNVLGWDDKLLNNDDGAKYDNVDAARKRVITDNIEPDLKIFSEAMTKKFLPRFKAYQNTEMIFDISELPEMQTDISELAKWLNEALDRGVINRNEYRLAIKYTESDDPDMDVHTVSGTVQTLEEAMDSSFNVEPNPPMLNQPKNPIDDTSKL